MAKTKEASDRDIENAYKTGVYQNNTDLVDITYQLLEPNLENFGWHRYEKRKILEIKNSTYSRRDKTTFPKIHFLLTGDFVYLNGGFFPFNGTDYPQYKKANMVIVHHFLEMLFMWAKTTTPGHDAKIRDLPGKYKQDNDDIAALAKHNADAFFEAIQGAVDDIEDSAHYNPAFNVPQPVIDVETLERTLLTPYSKFSHYQLSHACTRNRQYGQYLKLCGHYDSLRETIKEKQTRKSDDGKRTNSRDPESL